MINPVRSSAIVDVVAHVQQELDTVELSNLDSQWEIVTTFFTKLENLHLLSKSDDVASAQLLDIRTIITAIKHNMDQLQGLQEEMTKLVGSHEYDLKAIIAVITQIETLLQESEDSGLKLMKYRGVGGDKPGLELSLSSIQSFSVDEYLTAMREHNGILQGKLSFIKKTCVELQKKEEKGGTANVDGLVLLTGFMGEENLKYENRYLKFFVRATLFIAAKLLRINVSKQQEKARLIVKGVGWLKGRFAKNKSLSEKVLVKLADDTQQKLDQVDGIDHDSQQAVLTDFFAKLEKLRFLPQPKAITKLLSKEKDSKGLIIDTEQQLQGDVETQLLVVRTKADAVKQNMFELSELQKQMRKLVNSDLRDLGGIIKIAEQMDLLLQRNEELMTSVNLEKDKSFDPEEKRALEEYLTETRKETTIFREQLHGIKNICGELQEKKHQGSPSLTDTINLLMVPMKEQKAQQKICSLVNILIRAVICIVSRIFSINIDNPQEKARLIGNSLAWIKEQQMEKSKIQDSKAPGKLLAGG